MTTSNTELAAQALKPCPFCGGEATLSKTMDESIWSHETVPYHQVKCTECGIGTEPLCEGWSPTAEEAWNRRADAVESKAEPVAKPLDDPRLQELFTACISGALMSGYQGASPPPAGHWLWFWWDKGAVARRDAAPVQPEKDERKPHAHRMQEVREFIRADGDLARGIGSSTEGGGT